MRKLIGFTMASVVKKKKPFIVCLLLLLNLFNASISMKTKYSLRIFGNESNYIVFDYAIDETTTQTLLDVAQEFQIHSVSSVSCCLRICEVKPHCYTSSATKNEIDGTILCTTVNRKPNFVKFIPKENSVTYFRGNQMLGMFDPLGGFFYRLFPKVRVYHTASEVCKTYSSRLPILKTDAEIEGYMNARNFYKENREGGVYYVGMSKDEVSNTWIWDDGTAHEETPVAQTHPVKMKVDNSIYAYAAAVVRNGKIAFESFANKTVTWCLCQYDSFA